MLTWKRYIPGGAKIFYATMKSIKNDNRGFNKSNQVFLIFYFAAHLENNDPRFYSRSFH